MRLSLWPSVQQPWPDLLAEAQHAERTGWHTLYVWDHFMGDGGGFGEASVPTLESTAVLAGLAVGTSRMRIGSLVFGNTYRHPAVLANWAASVDQMSGGRLVLGIGAGWQQNEHEQYGIELPAPAGRLAMLDEACSVLTSLLAEQRSTFDGEHYRLDDALCEPKPVQAKVPLLVGGKGDRMLKLVAHHADAWNMWGLPSTIAERAGVLDRACERIGRDPFEIGRSAQALVMLTDDDRRAREFVESVAPRAVFAGTAEQFAELVQEWSDVGVDEVIVPDAALGTGHRRLEHLDALRAAMPL